ncbi:MAG: outer membrane beta-barrel protein [Gemmatimonadota bacterium]|nr:outer membrane beta-barrel protein [Gemmatimonadota bacterium]MDH3423827.1 outer membrane beta-barrel protein [Gemmatimonadota bacterium]
MSDSPARCSRKQVGINALVFAVLACAPISAQAQWSVGGSLGVPDADIDVAVYDPPNTTADDSSPISWKLFVGYGFSANLGLEAGYVALGSEYQLFNALGYGESVTFEPSAGFITVLGRVNVHDRVQLLARLGAAYWTTDVDYAEGAFRSSGSDGDVDPLLGFGFEFTPDGRFTIRFEWEQFQNVGDDASVARPAAASSRIELGGHDISVIGLGVNVRF